MPHILMVEDEDRIASFVKKGLLVQGFQLAIALGQRLRWTWH